MKFLLTRAALDTMLSQAEHVRSQLPRVIFVLKMVRTSPGVTIGFIPSDYTGEVYPLSEVEGLKIYVDEPDYINSVLIGECIDAVEGSFFTRKVSSRTQERLIEVKIVES